MSKKKNKKQKDDLKFIIDNVGNFVFNDPSYNLTNYTINTTTSTVTTSSTGGSYNILYSNDDYNTLIWHDELAEIREKEEEEEKLRNEFPVLKEAWDHYQLVRKLFEEEECDKYIKEKYKGFEK